MSNKLKENKALVESVLNDMFGAVNVEWNKASHPVGVFYVDGCKFTYSVDKTNDGDYTMQKTRSMIVKSLQAKAVQWGYINDPSQFKERFMKG